MFPNEEQRYVQYVSDNNQPLVGRTAPRVELPTGGNTHTQKRLYDKDLDLFIKLWAQAQAKGGQVPSMEGLAYGTRVRLQLLLDRMADLSVAEEAKRELIREHEDIELPEEPKEEPFVSQGPQMAHIGPPIRPPGRGLHSSPGKPDSRPELPMQHDNGNKGVFWFLGLLLLVGGAFFVHNNFFADNPALNPTESNAATQDSAEPISAQPPALALQDGSGSTAAKSEIGPINDRSRRELTSSPRETSGATQMNVIITPLRNRLGSIYGAEAHAESSGVLLATADQVAMEDELLVVRELQYDTSGKAVYEGKLFFSQSNELVKEEAVSGERRWKIFDNWVSDNPY